jgi:hypothetical protein
MTELLNWIDRQDGAAMFLLVSALITAAVVIYRSTLDFILKMFNKQPLGEEGEEDEEED